MFDSFNHIVVLNLKTRQDRKAQTMAEFKRAGIDKYEFFGAIPGGFHGFCASQAEMFKAYKDKGSILIFEDDIQFVGDISIVDKAFKELPNDWDMLYLGANVKEDLTRYSENLYTLNNAWTTHAIGYSQKMITYLTQTWTGGYVKPFIYDEWLRREIQPIKKCFIVYPMIATQRPNYSDLWGTIADYKIILDSQKHFK